MSQQPILKTPRLVLRPFTLDDAPVVQQLASTREIAMTTLHIPHPYPEGAAEAWISSHPSSFELGTSATFAITLHEQGTLCGAIGLQFDAANNHAELGYWIGVPYWSQGYATEAGQAMLRYGFEQRGLHRIHAAYFRHNPASGRVMQKLGMAYEGCRRQHLLKWGEYIDLMLYGILRSEWQSAAPTPPPSTEHPAR